MTNVADAKLRLEAAKTALASAKEELTAAKKELQKAKEAPVSKKRKAPDSSADLEGLQKAVKKARKAMKADKNKETKKALREAKAALEAAEEAAKKAKESSSEESSSEEEEEEEEEEKPKKVAEVDIGIKKGGAAAAKADTGAVDNPTNCAKVFLGNLSWSIDDDAVKGFFADCGEITDLHWLEDKETGKFKGCGFCTFDSAEAASKAVAMSGLDLLERPIKVEFSLPKPKRDARPSGGSKFASKPLSAKPENCTTVFVGNLSWDIDDDGMRSFAEDCGELQQIRWLTDRETGDFKGCGFLQFYDTEAVDKFVLKNGNDLMGRQIRIDYSESRR